ncbi:hypothetical protein [Domibacillus indicus]|uniref:hypothetical protein n=1 Tax=Domibacillus indicus TaxID=1437523 RepID=UPI000618094B|nr:hypothetical protein [Domibacillus indicus]
MTPEEAVQSIENLRNETIKILRVQKEDFLSFRQELIKQQDFKHFRGIAKHGGHVEYEYMKIPRS